MNKTPTSPVIKNIPSEFVFATMCIVCIIWICSIIYHYEKEKKVARNRLRENLVLSTRQVKEEIQMQVRRISREIDSVAILIEHAAISPDSATIMLKTIMEHDKLIESTVIAYPKHYRKHTVKPSDSLFAPFLRRVDGQIIFQRLDSIYAYADPSEKCGRWFTSTVADVNNRNKGIWLSPFWGCGTSDFIVSYARTFSSFSFNNKTDNGNTSEHLGVVLATVSIDSLRSSLQSAGLGIGGYSALVSGDGIFISHPQNRYIGKPLSEIHDATRIYLDSLSRNVKKGATPPDGVRDHRSTTAGLFSWYAYSFIPENNWSIHNTFIRGDLENDTRYLMGVFGRLIFPSSLLFMCLCLIVFRKYHFDKKRMHGCTTPVQNIIIVLSSILLLALNIALIRNVIRSHNTLRIYQDKILGGLTVMDGAASKKSKRRPHGGRGSPDSAKQENGSSFSVYDSTKYIVMDTKNRELVKNLMIGSMNTIGQRSGKIDSLNDIFTVPTGLFIENIRFIGPSLLEITGSIWQRYNKERHKKIRRNIHLPNCEVLTLDSLAYCRDGCKANDTESVKEWRFKLRKTENFDCRKYPLEYERILIEIQQDDPEHKVLLTPDLESYQLTSPASKPFLRVSTHLPGWEINNCFFSSYFKTKRVYFGEKYSFKSDYYPTLGCSITIERNFGNILFSYLVPIISVILLLYLAMSITIVDSERADMFKSDVTKTITFCSSLLFVLVYSHIRIRTQIEVSQIFFLEWIYIIAYGGLISVILSIIYFKQFPRIALWFKTMFIPLTIWAIGLMIWLLFYH